MYIFLYDNVSLFSLTFIYSFVSFNSLTLSNLQFQVYVSTLSLCSSAENDLALCLEKSKDQLGFEAGDAGDGDPTGDDEDSSSVEDLWRPI